jgi:hypothetical protein
MATFADTGDAFETLQADILQRLEQKFGASDLFDLDDILFSMLVYRDTRELLGKPGIQLVLNNISENVTNEKIVAENLSALNDQVEAMRSLHLVASAEDPQAIFNELATAALLDEAQTAQLLAPVQGYMSALQKIADPADVRVFDFGTEAMLRCLSSDVITAYLDDFYASKHWLQPVPILFDLEKLASSDSDDGDENIDAAISSFRLEFLRQENEYQAAVEYFQKIQQPFLADVAQFLLMYMHIVRNVADANQYVEAEVASIEQVVQRLESYNPDEWQSLGAMEAFFKPTLGSMHMLLGNLAACPIEDRFRHLEKAESYFGEINLLPLQIQQPHLRWLRAQLLPDYKSDEREKLEAQALKQVHQLLTVSTLAEKPLDRVVTTTQLLLYPAQWKIAKGDFRSALETIDIAHSSALAIKEAMANEFGSTLEELQKALDDPDIPPDEKEQLHSLMDFLLPISQLADVFTFICDLLTQTCNAKLAESRGDFQQASIFYETAGRLEQDMLKLLLRWLSIFSQSASALTTLSGANSSQYAIRAEYFQGMALLNRGDRELMEMNNSDARKNYQEAKHIFKTAASQWESILFDPSSPADARANANREKNLCEDRAFYCDAKIEIAQAQQHSTFHEFIKASESFRNAAETFAALVGASQERGTTRNLKILKASEEFCKGCALFEMARNDKREEIKREARELVDSAALLFEEANEARWAKYIRALRFEYEADFYRKMAYDSASPLTVAHAQLAESNLREATNLFRQLGMEHHVRDLERSAQTMAPGVVESFILAPIALPKPADTTMPSQGSAQGIGDMAKISQVAADLSTTSRLDRLYSQAYANEQSLIEIDAQVDKGLFEPGRAVIMIGDQNQKRAEILLQVRAELEGLDENLDAILPVACASKRQGPDKEQIDQFEQIAATKGIPASIINTLKNKPQLDIIFWLIEIGKQLMKVSSTN